MNKNNNFKIVKGVTLIANLSLGLWLGMFITGGIYLYKLIINIDKIPYLIIFVSFIFFSIISSFLNIWAGKKLEYLNLEGTAKQLNNLAINYSKWFMFPLFFAITINRVRSAMWDYIITKRTSTIDDPVKQVEEEYKIIEEWKKDEFISHHKYNNLKEKKEERLKEAREIQKIQKEQNNKSIEEDPWIE